MIQRLPTILGAIEGPRAVVSVGASPATITNTTNARQTFIVSGGTVTTIEFSRDGVTFDVLGVSSGQFMLNDNDSLKITYVSVPTVTRYPM